MKLAKYFLLFVASIALLACSKGDDDAQQNEEPQPEKDTPVKVEPLPEGVKLKDETIQLNNIQLSKITSVDEENTTLTFDASTPQDQIPQKGQILLQFSPTKELPYGFIGRVTDVKESNGKIVVETEAPALNEAFDKLVVNYDSNTAKAASRSGSEGNLDIIEDGLSFDNEGYINFTKNFKSDDSLVESQLIFGLNPSININIDNSKNIDEQLYGFGVKASAITKFKLSIEKESNNRSNIGKGVLFKLPNVTPAVCGALQLYSATEAKGEFSCSATVTSTISKSFRVEYNGILEPPKVTSTGEDHNPVVDFSCDPEVKLSGELYTGLGLGIELRLFGRKELHIGVGSEVGPQVSTEIDLLSDPTSAYTKFKDTAIELNGVYRNRAYAAVKLFKYEREWEHIFVNHNWNIAKRYIFPEFKNLSFNESDKVHCKATVSRDLFFPLEIGFGQYNENNEAVQRSEGVGYQLEQDFANPLTADLSNDTGENYTYSTYVKLGDKYIKCEQANHLIVGRWLFNICYTYSHMSFVGKVKSTGEDYSFVLLDNYSEYTSGDSRILNSDGTCTVLSSEIINDFDGPYTKTWSTTGNTLYIYYDDGTINYVIENISDTELVLRSDYYREMECGVMSPSGPAIGKEVSKGYRRVKYIRLNN